MKFPGIFAITAVIFLNWSACSPKEQWTSLLEEDLHKSFDTYLGPSYDTITTKFDSIPAGLNNDPTQVFSMVTLDKEAVLRISGERFGGVSTKEEFHNYHLQLQFKWGISKYAPKKNDKRDSGLLYHAGGKHGADFGFWMRSQELQIQEGDCGDYWGVAGGSAAATAIRDSAQFTYDPQGTLYTFNEKSPQGRRCIRKLNAENSYGDWNTIDLYCYGDTAVHAVNGKVVMVLLNSAYLNDGKLTPLKSGKLQLQSEGAEIFYRNIRIRKLRELPKELFN